jgi:hypothetical protein
MTHELERKLVYLGSYESGLHHLTIPRAILAPVEQKLDAERQQREREADRAKAKVMQDVRGRHRLKKALAMVVGRRGR